MPSNFDGFYKFEENVDSQNCDNFRPTKVPVRLNEYELTEPDMQPQIHTDLYKYRNTTIPGQLIIPQYHSVKYGRNSLKHASILLWNNFKKLFPNTDFVSLPRVCLKNMIVKYFIDKYKETDMSDDVHLDLNAL